MLPIFIMANVSLITLLPPLSVGFSVLRVGIHGLPADAELARAISATPVPSARGVWSDSEFAVAGPDGRLASMVLTSPLRNGYAFPLPLEDHGALETGYGAHNRKHQGCHRGIFPGKSQRLFDEFDFDFPVGKIRDDPEQVSQVAGQAVHGVTDQRIAFARPFKSGL